MSKDRREPRCYTDLLILLFSLSILIYSTRLLHLHLAHARTNVTQLTLDKRIPSFSTRWNKTLRSSACARTTSQ